MTSLAGTERLTTTRARLEHLSQMKAAALSAGSSRAVEKQHAKGKLTARERIDMLLDPGSFEELDAFARHLCTDFGLQAVRPLGDGVVTGYGTVNGRTVCVFSQDFTVFGGALGAAYGQKIVKVMDLALKIGCPVVGINDSGGARIQEGVSALAAYAHIARRTVRISGVVPQISMILGPCAGGAVYTPAGTDFTVMTRDTSHMFVTGPEVVYAATGERTTLEELGGADANAANGNTHYVAADEAEAFEWVRSLLSYLPSNNTDDSMNSDEMFELELTSDDVALDKLVPDNPNSAYDMSEVIRAISDNGDFFEISPNFGHNLLCGFIRLEGRVIGVVANQPKAMAGILDINASEKGARFVRFLDAYNLPILTLVDVPGFLPGVDQERAGVIRRGAKLPYAYAEATVPMVTVVVRKCYGGGYAVMGCKQMGTDLTFAWPTAEFAVLGAEGAVTILYRNELEQAKQDGVYLEMRAKLVDELRASYTSPYIAAEGGFIDAVIRPASTRAHVTRAFRSLRTKVDNLPMKKHGNMPL